MFFGGVKKVIAVIMIFFIISSNIPIFAEVDSTANNFIDVKGHYAEKIINEWSKRGAISGYPDKTFLPDTEITRAEFVSIMTRVFEFNASGNKPMPFFDVKENDWYYDNILTVSNQGIINGTGSKFNPLNFITREDAACIISRYLSLSEAYDKTFENKYIDASKISPYAISHVAAMTEMEFINGFPIGTFRPQKFMSRAETIILFNNVITSIYGSSGITGKVYSDSQVIKNTNILITKKGDTKVLVELISDSNGAFEIDLEPGIYDLVAHTIDDVNFHSSVEVKKDKQTLVKIAIEEGQNVKGIIKNSDGTPAANEYIAIKTNPYFFAQTNQIGEFNILLPKNLDYTIHLINNNNLVQLGSFSTTDNNSLYTLSDFVINEYQFAVLQSENNETSNPLKYITKSEWINWLLDKLDIMPIEPNAGQEYSFSDISMRLDGMVIETANSMGFLPDHGIKDNNIDNSSSTQFNPEEKATREFVSYTLAKALGFSGSNSIQAYDINDIDFVSEVSVAVKNDFFALKNGYFLPDVGITTSDLTKINDVIDELNDSVYFTEDEFVEFVSYDKDLILIQESSYTIIKSENNQYTVNIIKNEKTEKIITGSVFKLSATDDFMSGVSLKAINVVEIGDQLHITCGVPEIEEVIEEIKYVGIGRADISKLAVEDGVVAEYNPNGAIIQNEAQLAPFDINVNESLPGTVEFDFFEKEILNTGITVSGDIEIAIPNVSAKVEGKVITGFELEELTATIQKTAIVSSKISYDFGIKEFENINLDTPPQIGQGKIKIGHMPFVLGATGLTLDLVLFLNVEIGGEVSIGFEIDGIEGIQYKNETFRKINEYDFDMTNIEIKAEAKVGLGVALNFSIFSTIELIGFEIQAGAALGANFEIVKNYGDDIYCSDVDYYVYLSFGTNNETITGDLISFNLDIWDESSSPHQSNWHFENGKKVNKCTVNLGQVRGSVYDLYSNEPLSGVKVDFYNKQRNTITTTITTDSLGAYNFEQIPEGVYELRYSKEDYSDCSFEFEVKGNRTNQVLNVNLEKHDDSNENQENGILEVVVRSSIDESIVTGYEYDLRRYDNNQISESVLTGIYNDSMFEVSISPGNYAFMISKEGYISTFQNVTVLSESTLLCEIQITPEAIIEPEEPVYSQLRGRIIIKEPLDMPQTNVPIGNVEILITNKETLMQSSTQSDVSGSYIFEHIITGNYIVEINHEGYYSFQADVSIESDVPITKDIKLIRLGTKKLTDFVNLYYEMAYLGMDNYGDTYVWGENYNGIGVNSNKEYFDDPTPILNLYDIVQADCYYLITMAVDSNGDLWQWGDFTNGKNYQTFQGDGLNRDIILTPTKNTKVSNVKKVIINDLNSIVLKNDGTLWYSGYTDFSGNPDDASSSDEPVDVFTKVNGLSNIKDLYGNIQSYFALDVDDNLWSVGHYTENGRGIPEGEAFANDEETPLIILSNVKSVSSARSNTITALTNDGLLYSWGDIYTPELLMSDIVQAIVIQEAVIALKNDGTVWGWGHDTNAVFGTGENYLNLNEPTQIWPELQGIKRMFPLTEGVLIEMQDGKVYIIGDLYFDVTGQGLENAEMILIPTEWNYKLME